MDNQEQSEPCLEISTNSVSRISVVDIWILMFFAPALASMIIYTYSYWKLKEFNYSSFIRYIWDRASDGLDEECDCDHAMYEAMVDTI